MIRKRSEHGLGHLLNPLDPESDDRDWITHAYELILDAPDLLVGGGPVWLDQPALTRFALTSKHVARAFEAYNRDRSWPEQIKPFNFLLHAHVAPFGYPIGVDPTRFRLIAPYENRPELWLQLPWVELHSGVRYFVTTEMSTPSHTARLKTYRDVLALYAVHPEPKSLDPNGEPCSRRSPPGFLGRRPVNKLTISLIGKESNRLDETTAGLIGTLDDVLTTFGDPGRDAWNTLIVPALEDFPTHRVAELAGLDTRTIQRIKRRAITKSHDHNRKVLTIITAQLVAETLERWGLEARFENRLDQIAHYIDERDLHRIIAECAVCGNQLDNRRRRYCSPACKKRAYRLRHAKDRPGDREHA